MLDGSGNWTTGSLGDLQHKLVIEPGVPQRAALVQGTDGNLQYFYVSGADGAIHEFSFHKDRDQWSKEYVFPNSNAYGGLVALKPQAANYTCSFELR